MDECGSEVCLALGVTESFLPGAVVAVASFLKQHPRFGGGVVLFHDGMPEACCAAFERAFPPLRFESVRPALRERLARLGAALPALHAKLPNFYALEAFRLSGYRKVLYCDCDLLFSRPIDELFDREEVLLCCGDEISLRGLCRDAATYRPIDDPSGAGPLGALEGTFNSGLLLIDARLTGERTYSELLALVSPETWRGTQTNLCDQLILNRYFGGRQTIISATYNYQMLFAATIRAREALTAKDAKVLHFLGPVKPWMPETMLRWIRRGACFPQHRAFALWYETWMECLVPAHLRVAAGRWPKERRSGR